MATSKALGNVFKLSSIVNVKDPIFGATGDGVTDDSAAILATYASLPSTGGTIFFPPGTYRVDFTGADVISNPIVAVSITKDNVFLEGDGAVIDMTGITAAQLNAGSADTAGADAATVFNFNGVDGGGVSGIRFTGTGGGTAITVGKARAKGIGIYNSRRIELKNVTGANIPGNLINLRGDTGSAATSTADCVVSNCVADTCSENGINFMGGTYRCSAIGNMSNNNKYHGFEFGTLGLVAKGNIAYANAKTGISTVGDGSVISGNFLTENVTGGINLSYSSATYDGSNACISGNKIAATGAGSYGIGLTPTAAGEISHVAIDGNEIETAYYGILTNTGSTAGGSSALSITGNIIKNTGTTNFPILIGAKTKRFVVSGNYIEGGNTGLKINTRSATISDITVTSNVVTVTTSAVHGFTSGDRVFMSASATTYAGVFDIASVPTTTSFTFAMTTGDDAGPNAGGTAQALECSSFSIIGNQFYNQSADCVVLQGYKFHFKQNTLIPASGASRSGQAIYADKMEIVDNALRDHTFSISTSILAAATPPKWNIYGNTGEGAILYASTTWDPASLIDAAGATSSAITVSNVEFGDTVTFAAPYDLQGITANAYVSAANAVKIRLQNETGGTIDLASGTWKVWAEKRQW